MRFKEWLKISGYEGINPLSVKGLYCYERSLTDLDGIQEFKNLIFLDCSGNDLTSLKEIEHLKSLTKLHCYSNNLTNLNGIENLTNLKALICSNNNLEHDYCTIDFKSIKNYQQYLKTFYRKDKIKNIFKL